MIQSNMVNQNYVKILLIEDNPGDIQLIKIWIGEDTFRLCTIEATRTLGEALHLLSIQTYDIILLDLGLPDSSGITTYQKIKEYGFNIPVIILTGSDDIIIATQCIDLGAQDYLVKDHVRGYITHAIHNALGRALLTRDLRLSYENYRKTIDNMKDATVVLDLSKKVLFSNKAAQALLDGKVNEGCIFNLDIDKITEEREFINLDGKTVYTEIKTSDIEWYGKNAKILSIRDNTEKKMAEDEKIRISALLSHYLTTSPTIIYSLILKDGSTRWQWVSENISRILGYSSEEVIIPDWWFNNLHANDRSRMLNCIVDLMKDKTTAREYRFKKKDQSYVWLHDEMRLVPGFDKEIEVVGTLTDISELKKDEEEIHLKSAALEAAANAVIITDTQGIIKWANKAFEILSGYSKEEVIGKNPRSLIKSGKETTETYQKLWATITAGNVWEGEIINRNKQGLFYTEEMTITPVSDSSQHITNYVAIKSDISERKRSEQVIQKLLSEKEILLKEVHHRIKNNMTTIKGLLSMQIEAEKNPSAAESLQDAESRVNSIIMLYDRLYCTENYRELSLKDYLEPLAEEIISTFSNNNISTHFDITDFILNIRYLSPLGIIANELLTNMMKHAFKNRDQGLIYICANDKEKHVTVTFEDNGIGLPDYINLENSTGLGFKMVRLLIEQMGGKIRIERKEGSKFILEFDKE